MNLACILYKILLQPLTDFRELVLQIFAKLAFSDINLPSENLDFDITLNNILAIIHILVIFIRVI